MKPRGIAQEFEIGRNKRCKRVFIPRRNKIRVKGEARLQRSDLFRR